MWCKVWRNQVQASESLGPAEKDSTPFIPPAADCDDTGEMLWAVEAYQRFGTQGFYWIWILMQASLPDLNQKSGFPVGKQVFSINHIIGRKAQAQ